MNFKKFLMIPLFAALPLVTGCGNDCKSACEDGNDCPGVTMKADCDKVCDDAEKLADDASCSDQYDDLMSCASDQDACKPDANACKSETEKMIACMTPYCTKNPDKCASVPGGGDSGT